MHFDNRHTDTEANTDNTPISLVFFILIKQWRGLVLLYLLAFQGVEKLPLIDSILKFYEHESDEHKVIVHVNFDKIIPTNVERILIEESKEKSLEVSKIHSFLLENIPRS